MKICKPFFDASPNLISQKFGNIQPDGKPHTGLDIQPLNKNRGAMLVAPCRVKITNIVDNYDLDSNDDEAIRHGYGIAMQPLEGNFPPDTFFLYWHCQGIFPVEIGQIVEMGQPVAQMGNSGYVMSGGMYVPIGQRNIPPYYGIHVHFEYFIGDSIEGRKYMDVLPLIDWTIPVSKQSILDGIALLLKKISKLINK
jgi:hypothetical protein